MISGQPIIAWFFRALRDWIWLGLTFFLVLEFAIYIGGYDPDPGNVALCKVITKDRIVSLQDISPNIETLRNIYRLDTDSDGFEEWVTFIKNEAQAYSAAIYDKEPCRAPELEVYPLSAISNDYVAERLSNTFTNPWSGPYMSALDGAVPKPAVVILSRDGQTLNIFKWVDEAGNKCQQAEPYERRYDVIGTFRGNGGVTLNGSRVTTLDRDGFERSQFSVSRTYLPINGSYLQPNGNLVSPVEGQITFQFDHPNDLVGTFYPEKAVLAFYLALFQRGGGSAEPDVKWTSGQYLSTDKLKPENQVPGAPYSLSTSTFGLAGQRSDMVKARVMAISYAPNVQSERAFQPQTVTVEAIGVDSSGRSTGPVRSITWTVVADPRTYAAPYGCEWKLNQIVNVAGIN